MQFLKRWFDPAKPRVHFDVRPSSPCVCIILGDRPAEIPATAAVLAETRPRRIAAIVARGSRVAAVDWWLTGLEKAPWPPRTCARLLARLSRDMRKGRLIVDTTSLGRRDRRRLIGLLKREGIEPV